MAGGVCLKAGFLALACCLLGRLCCAQDAQQKPRTDLYGDPLPMGAVARLGTLRFRNVRVSPGSLTPDGATLVCIGPGKDLSLLHPSNGTQQALLHLTDSPVGMVHCSPNGQTLATAGQALTGPGVICLFDYAQRRKIAEFYMPHNDAVRGMDFSADSQRLFVTSRSQAASYLFRADSGELIRKGTPAWAYSCSAGIAGIAGGVEANGAIRLWEISTDKPITTWSLERTKARVFGPLAISADGKTLAIASGFKLNVEAEIRRGIRPHAPDDHEIYVFDVPTRQMLSTLRGHIAPVREMALSADGSRRPRFPHSSRSHTDIAGGGADEVRAFALDGSRR